MRVLLINCVSDTPEVNLYFGLKAAGIELSLILDPRDEAAESLRAAGIPVQQKKIRNRFDFAFDAFLKATISDFKPDLIHAPASRGVAAALRVTRGSAIRICTYRGTLGNLNRFSLLARLAHLHPRVAVIFCNCNAVKEFLGTLGVADHKLHIVYKGHDPRWYQSAQPYSRKDFGISEDSFVVGCFANIRPLKGVDILVRAVDLLDGLPRPIVCLLVGDSRDKKLEQLVEKRGLSDRVKFLGFRKDVPQLIPLCDVTVMPSVRREGFPRAVVESYCNGVPAICTSIGGMPEIVKDGETGIIVPPGDVQALADALRTVAQNSTFWRTAGATGKNFVARTFSLESYVTGTLAAFRTLSGTEAHSRLQ